MAVTPEKLRQYLNLPPDSTEDMEVYLAAAKSKVRSAGVPDFKNNAHYDLFIYALAAVYYDNRGMAFSGSYLAAAEENTRRLINSFVLELRYTKDDSGGAGNG